MMIKLRAINFLKLFSILSVFIFINGCEAVWPFYSIDEIPANNSRNLKIGLVKNPLVILKNSTGYEHDLIQRFAEDLGYKVQWTVYKNPTDILKDLEKNKIDIGLGRFNSLLSNQYSVLEGPAYEETNLSLVCPKVKTDQYKNNGVFQKLFSQTRSIPSYIHDVLILNHNSLYNFKNDFEELYQNVNLHEVNNKRAYDLFRMAFQTKSYCLLAENMETKFYLRSFPNLQQTEQLDDKFSVSFLISKTRPEVQMLLNNWIRKAHRKGIIENIRDQYLSHLNTLDDFERLQFFRDIQFQQKDLFPKFKKIAKEFDLPWQLVAAVAYQESHWDNEAASFTGVKGIMMLTQETANYLGVKDREDLEQSLWGGTKYLRMLIQMQPKQLTFRSKLILALASYNVGIAHLRDAQKIAYNEGYNPLAWHDLKLVLPRLSDSSYLSQLDYGYARGQEPIDFVNHILNYFEILSINKSF